MRVFDGLKELLNLGIVSLSLDVDAAIRQVPDPAGHFVAVRDFLNRKAESYALNTAFVDYASGDHSQ
jgi:hypothetical protein